MSYQDAQALFGNSGSTSHQQYSQVTEYEYKKPPEKWMIEAEKFVYDCARNLNLPQNVKHLDFLKSKHLSEKMIRLAMIGYNPKDQYISRGSWGLDEEVNENGQNKKLWLPKGIVIPYAFEGNIIRIRVRRENENDTFGRYVIASGSSSRPMVFGIKNDCMVVESELDALLMYQECGYFISIIGLGSASTKPKFDILKTLKMSRKILVSLDRDNAGFKASSWWIENFPNCAKRLPPIGGKDPSEMANSKSLREWAVSAFINPDDKHKSFYNKVEIPGILKNVIYSDTDSVISCMPTNVKNLGNEEKLKYAEMYASVLNKGVSGMMNEFLKRSNIDPKYNSLDFKVESVIDKIVFVNKKQMAFIKIADENGVYDEPVIVTKGLNQNRSNSSLFSKELEKKIIEILFADGKDQITRNREMLEMINKEYNNFSSMCDEYLVKSIGVPGKYRSDKHIAKPFKLSMSLTKKNCFDIDPAGWMVKIKDFKGHRTIAIPFGNENKFVRDILVPNEIKIDTEAQWEKVYNPSLIKIVRISNYCLF